MAQWASAYAEAALGLSKALGDLAGPCMFAVTMGISRIIFGKYGEQLDLMKFMSGSGILCVVCYLLAALSSSPIIGLIGCIASSEAPEQIIRHIATQKNGLENRFLIPIPEPLSTRGSIGQVMKL